MDSQFIIDKLRDLKNEIPRLRALYPKSNQDEFCRWKESVAGYTLAALNNDTNHPLYERMNKLFSDGQNNVPAFRRHYLKPTELAGIESIIENVISLIENNNKGISSISVDRVEILTDIFKNFHRFAQQLKIRQNGASPISIEDEYALQDYIHAILRLHFRDVKNEVSQSKYCGKESRIDFALKGERIGIEVKFASENLKDGRLRNQLIEDKEQYIKSSQFDVIIFFIYDPQMVLNKPEDFYDLEEQTDKCDIIVVVAPTA
jgi:hypothetical protein